MNILVFMANGDTLVLIFEYILLALCRHLQNNQLSGILDVLQDLALTDL